MIENVFYKQAELLLDVLPHISAHPYFALKGGSAINLFVRDLPRLSVDIDLTYLPIKDRDSTLRSIHNSLSDVSLRIEERMPNIQTNRIVVMNGMIGKLFLERFGSSIKIEPNLVFRGTVFPVIDQDGICCLSCGT